MKGNAFFRLEQKKKIEQLIKNNRDSNHNKEVGFGMSMETISFLT